MARQPSNNELQKNYEVTIQAPLDSRLSVLNLTDLLDKNSWFKLVEDDFGEEEVAFMAYKGMPVSNTAEGDLYILKDYKEGPSVSDSQISFQKVATEEWVQTYADNNDTDTKYGIEYDADNKKIKLVEGGLTTEIDASDFIKDGMLSSVVADQDNNKLTFYWNTAAGIETTEIALSSIADIYTGKKGNRIEVTVGTDNTINADLVKGSISKDYFNESIQSSLALADSAVQDSDIDNFATSESVAAVNNALTIYKTSNDEVLAQVKATADAAAVKTEVEAGFSNVDKKFENYKTAEAQKAIDDEQDRKLNIIESDYLQAADITKFETKENVKKVSDDLAAYIKSNDSALAGVKTTAEAARTEDEVDSQIDAKIAVLNLADTYEPIGAETRAKGYVDSKLEEANLAQYTTEQEVKDIVDAVVTGAVDGDTITGLANLVDYINTHGGEAAEMASAIDVLEGQVKVIEETPAYDITPTQISNWDSEVGAKQLAESKTTTAEVKTQIEAYGYAKVDNLGELAYEDNLSASDIGAYTKEEVDDLISSLDITNLVTLDGDQTVSGKKVFENFALTIPVQEVSWSEDLMTNQVDLSGATLIFSTGTLNNIVDMPYFSTSSGYRLVGGGGRSQLDILDPNNMSIARIYYNGWNGDSFTLPNDFGFIAMFSVDNAVELLNETFPVILIPESPVEKIVFNENKYIAMPDESGIVATQEWVEAQGYGQGSGSIDTTKFVTLDKEQTISGNKTFTGEVDFSDATVKGLEIDPADVDLAGYATEDWVKSQGFVTASYLDNILTFSTSGSEASAVNYSNDEVLFTEDLYVTNPVGNFVSGDNVKGLSLQEIITRLLKLETNI